MPATLRTHQRPGAILLIVLVILALFAVIGISFVLFAQAEATTAGIQKEAVATVRDVRPDPAPSLVYFFRQLIYSAHPSMGMQYDGGIKSALYGHDLARTMYGFHPHGLPSLPNQAPNPNYNPLFHNWIPYSGIGNFAEALNHVGPGVVRQQVINHTAINTTDPIVEPELASVARTAAQAIAPPGLLAPMPPGSVYVGKNAPYTYPDLNNVALGMMDPQTGRIVQPSFHRPAIFGPLDPANPNWTTPLGRYRILRPRPIDHVYDSGDGRGPVSDFPYPPSNPDGTITGDVQNMRWINNTQANDSVWLHADLPPATFRGRTIQPLVAALVLPLDGRVNLEVAGNRRGTGGAHSSHMGFGPWEINPAAVLVPPQPGLPPTINAQVEGPGITAYRYGDPALFQPLSAPQAIAAINHPFDSSSPVPAIDKTLMDYSVVNWQALPANRLQLPSGFQTEPVLPVLGWENNRGTGQRHQSLYNPFFLRETLMQGGRRLALNDFRQLAYRYSAISRLYTPPLYGNPNEDNSFSGDGPNHPSRLARANTTIFSNSLARGGLMPNFPAIGPGSYILQPPPANDPFRPARPMSTAVPFTPVAPPPNSDNIPGLNGYRSTAAALGPVDLNRPLADYRLNINEPLSSPANVNAAAVQSLIAHRDRQQLAQDIFERLVLATGAPYDTLVDGRPVGFTQAQATPDALNALRYLAQIAVNIVDFIDNDDVCTAFVWNPINPASPAPEQDLANYGDLANRVVFGVEKPRLVLNEVYSEITNDPVDANTTAARRDFQVKFFIELLNPLNNQLPRGAANPAAEAALGDGSAMLRIGGHSVYRVQIYDNSTAVYQQLMAQGQTNVTGAPQPPVQPRLSVPMPANAISVEPNNGQPGNTGFRELVPQVALGHPDSTGVYVPQPGPQVITVPNSPALNQLFYTERAVLPRNIPQTMERLNPSGQGRHAVLLQRLANPYLPEAPNNPYITVDSMWQIRVHDGIQVGQEEQRPPPLPPIPGIRQPGQDRPPLNQRQSHARRAPLLAFHNLTPPNSPPQSFTVESPMTPDAATTGRFHRHNDHANPLQPFEWLIHFDRKLVSPAELFHVAAVKPHELLHYFVTSRTAATDTSAALMAAPGRKQRHAIPWRALETNLYRALELLRIKPWMYAVPLGGREPGRINANAIWSQEVFNALLDPQAANEFNLAEASALWTTLFTGGASARTPNLGTIDLNDQPIYSYGAANLEQTLLRTNPNMVPLPGTPDRPTVAAFQLDPINPMHAHPYQQWEMLRKAANNLNTTSDTFLVIVTIGYFEIRAPAGGNRLIPVLGREVFDEVPGDMRQRFAAVVDRSMLAVSPLPLPPGTPVRQATNIFYTEVAANLDPFLNDSEPVTLQIRCQGGVVNNYLDVEYEGTPVRIRPTPVSGSLGSNEVSVLVLGTGADAQYVVLGPGVSIQPPVGDNGIGSITFPPRSFQPQVPGGWRNPATNQIEARPARLRKIYAGEAVSSVIPGNPGPQLGFDYNLPAYRQIIRDLRMIDP